MGDRLDELREDYWRVICRTRKTGKVSGGVRKKSEEAWKKYKEDIIKEALRIHISRYPHMTEKYTLGIMRNLEKQRKQKQRANPSGSGNAWQSTEQREYDFEALERELLGE